MSRTIKNLRLTKRQERILREMGTGSITDKIRCCINAYGLIHERQQKINKDIEVMHKIIKKIDLIDIIDRSYQTHESPTGKVETKLDIND